jgi:elongation factor Ts
MVTGRLKKFYSQVCLLNQPYVRDDSITIEQLQSELVGKIGEPVTVRRFARYQVGEELE